MLENTLAYGNGIFVAAGNNGVGGAWSADGVTWTGFALVCEKTSLYFGGGKFVVVSNNAGALHTSSDAQTWSSKTLPANTTWTFGAYGAGRHVVISSSGDAAKSDDAGATWQAIGTNPATYDGRMAYGNGRFVALNSANADAVAYSTDGGANWSTTVISGASRNYTSIHFQQGVFLITDDGGQNLAVSTDAITWTTSLNDMPAALTNATEYAYNGAHRYAAIHQTNPGSTAGAWGDC